MRKIQITKELKKLIPEFKIGVVSFTGCVYSNTELDEIINSLQKDISLTYELSDILEIPYILAARNGYRRLGKDPSRYRLAVESLYRRIVKGKNLYRINNIVDIGNILSLETKRSVAVLDQDKIVGDINIRIGQNEFYEGIGRGKINIENIPVYCDNEGPFGSPTSDTEKTMITNETKHILVFIISFNGEIGLIEAINQCIDLYKSYARGDDFSYLII